LHRLAALSFVARLRHVDLLVVITPKLLDALLYVPMPIAPIQP
jgi:hypothetical protein